MARLLAEVERLTLENRRLAARVYELNTALQRERLLRDMRPAERPERPKP
jgi:hypothetical protein